MIVDYLNQIALSLAAILICGTMIVYTLSIHRTDRFRNKIFILVLIITVVCALCEAGKALVRATVSRVNTGMVLLDGLEYVHSIFHILIPMLFCFYIIYANGSHRHWGKVRLGLFLMPGIFMELLVITNPVHLCVYYHDSNLEFHGGWGMVVSYVLATVYILFGAINLIRHRQALSRRRFISVMLFFPVVVGGIVVQLLVSEVKSELFAVSLIMLGIMLTLENEDDRIDAATLVYNRLELKLVLRNMFRLELNFHVIAVRIGNYDILMRLSGKSGVDPIMQRVAEELKKDFPWYRIYRSSPITFMILSDLGEKETRLLSERIYARFQDGIYVAEVDTPITSVILRAGIPDELYSVEDVMRMVDAPLPALDTKEIVSGEQLHYLTRSTDLETALERGIRDGNFTVLYQPVHKIVGLEPYAVKALIRLKDPVLGEVMPGEFIPQAEQSGQIYAIGELVLRSVCEFICSGIPAKLGYECINVNLSFVECMQADFWERETAIVEEYGVDPEKINFEITKPVTKEDFDVLEKVIKQMKERGFHFSMEDFGAGYANVEAIFALDFDVVKIDRTILWQATKNEVGRIVLDNSIRMIKELDRKILVEGVETQEQVDLLRELDVDYLQGFYFSRPVSREELEKMAMLEDM